MDLNRITLESWDWIVIAVFFAAMISGFSREYIPDPSRTKIYSGLYEKYLALGSFTEVNLSF